ncbi:Uma2 family endonuclease [Limnoglobus roseus]|uniref:Uma2 family endonuclease n=1 Tax=Limnoglobus roseus TaxID=2598579 RepID=A0A5C1A695_9BACT|nr:Uma2 family endonuclease [Limnoglobus roseus]QEL13895.1 Uma2 family endonuclease [Limnoglobus roseus]
MSTATQTRMTADEFLQKHVHETGIELVDGQIVRLPMPGIKHGEVCLNVGAILRDYVKRNRLGRVCSNDSFVRIRPDAVRGPDVLFISYLTLPADQPAPKGAISPPLELVAEVRSPFDTVRAMTRKAEEYLDAGVQVALVFDPETSSVSVFRLNEFPLRLDNGDELTLPDVLHGFAVPVRQFFE